jgi:lipopolysaccharide/colanic/teichoic acid biosynthesis glycosyltransferase
MRLARRVADLCVAGGVLLVASPVFALLAVVNYALAGSPFFRQERLGRDLRPFVLLKFQTMARGGSAGSTVTVAGDARITRYGRVLRTLKLDELPQFINILRGEMSLVGPRPLTANEIEAVSPAVAATVYRVLPGLTGISALAFADEERVLGRCANPLQTYFNRVLPEKMTLELAYARRRTWMTDLAILAATPLASLVPPLRRWVVACLVPQGERVDDTVVAS